MWLFRSGIVLFAYTGINIYTGFRVLTLVKYVLPSARGYIFWPLYILLCYSYVLVFLLRLDRVQFLRQVVVFSLPFIVYFFLSLLFFDIIRLILHFLGRIPLSPGFSSTGTGIALVFALLVIVYGSINARIIRTTNYSIMLAKNVGGAPSVSLPRGDRLRIALISDLHLGTTVNRKWLANIVNAANAAEPDIICLAGDIFDNNLDSIEGLDGIAEELRRFSAPLGVYACQGNHDVDRLSLRNNPGTNRIQDFLKTADVVFLLDEVELVAGCFYLAGRRDARPIGMGSARKSAGELVSGLDTSIPIFFMDHQPMEYPQLDEAGADLILSGHTHRGQFFPGNVATKRIFREAGAVHYGYWRGKSAQAVVSSGAGVWGPPIRVLTSGELAVVDIQFGN